MNIKLIKYITILLLMVTGFAYSSPEVISHDNSRDNFYFGAGIGSSANHHDYDILNTTTGFLLDFKPNHNQVMGNAFLGYGYTACNNLYLAGEIGTIFPRRTTHFERPDIFIGNQTQLSIQDNVSGDVLLGYRFNRLLAYGRFGSAYSSVNFYQDAISNVSTPVFSSRLNQLSSRLGVGLNIRLRANFSLGLDYIFMDYQSLPVFHTGFPINSTLKPNTSYLAFSLIYSLC